MNGKKSKRLRRMVAGDPDMEGRVFAKEGNLDTWRLHPTSMRVQYQAAKKEERK